MADLLTLALSESREDAPTPLTSPRRPTPRRPLGQAQAPRHVGAETEAAETPGEARGRACGEAVREVLAKA